jgi:hypothetical protein
VITNQANVRTLAARHEAERGDVGDSERPLWLVVAYVRADEDGDGVSELLRVVYAHAGELLPPCFPGFRARGGEAENDPEGPFSAADLLEKDWSGRRDSNPRPRPWQRSSDPGPLVRKGIVTRWAPQTILR